MKKMMNLHYSNDNETKFCEIAYLVIYLSCKDESLKNTWLTSEVFAYSKPEWKIGFWDKACWTGFFYIFCHFFWHIWWFYKYLDCDYWLLSPKYAKNQNLQKMLLIQLSPFFGWFLVLIGRYPKILFWIPDPLLSLTLIRM